MSLQLRVAVLFAVACALALLPQAASAATITVNAGDNFFSGKTIDISPGDTVVWKNVGAMSHTVTADNGSFGSGTLLPGQTFSQTFTQAGSYPYYCKFHGGLNFQGMSGLVRVGSPGAGSQTVQPPVVQQQVAVQPPQQVTVPNPYAAASTPSSVTSQAQSLLLQVMQLQQLLASLKGTQNTQSAGGTVTGISSASCPRIGRTLKAGVSGDDVSRLQQYLATDRTVYPEALVSGYFGSLTQAAVQRWQTKYNIVASGNAETTGFGQVGPRTAAAIALQCSTAITTPGTPGTPANNSEVEAFMSVTPNIGDAPLTVSVQATVNSGSSCLAALYTLDWGDGSAAVNIPVALNSCATLQQTYTHVYPYGGSYVVKLSAGSHQSTATLLINGPLKQETATTTAPSVTVTSPKGGENITTGQTLAIGWQSTGTIPAGSSVVLDLYDGAGRRVAPDDIIAMTSYLSGALPWIVPDASGTQACPAVYPSGLCGVKLATGSYKIHASLHAPSSGGNTFGPVLDSDDSGVFTIISRTAPPVATTTLPAETFTATPRSGDAPLQVTFSGVVTSNDRGWCDTGCFDLLTYGDGGSDYVALPVSANSALSYSFTHTYQNPGTYSAVLYQGQTASTSTVGSAITVTVTGTDTPSDYTYGPLNVDYAVAGNPLSVTARFDLPSGCTGFKLSWGDGSNDIVQAHSTGCAQAAVLRSYTHQYASGGSYDIGLERGATLSQDDSVAIVISN